MTPWHWEWQNDRITQSDAANDEMTVWHKMTETMTFATIQYAIALPQETRRF